MLRTTLLKFISVSLRTYSGAYQQLCAIQLRILNHILSSLLRLFSPFAKILKSLLFIVKRPPSQSTVNNSERLITVTLSLSYLFTGILRF